MTAMEMAITMTPPLPPLPPPPLTTTKTANDNKKQPLMKK